MYTSRSTRWWKQHPRCAVLCMIAWSAAVILVVRQDIHAGGFAWKNSGERSWVDAATEPVLFWSFNGLRILAAIAAPIVVAWRVFRNGGEADD